jgi:glycosyltransferase involved in cell wall biosynthesis
MRLLMLPRYGPKGANSRYRLWQYVPLLQMAGLRVDVKPMLGDDYLEQLYERGRRPLWPTVKGYLKSIIRTLHARSYDAVVLDQELVPYFPSVFERLLRNLNPRLIVDYDDAAYFKYLKLPILRSKIARVMSLAQTVVVGNHHLAQYARQFSSHVTIIPTVVDHLKYKPRREHAPQDMVRICWIGTPITAVKFLKPKLPMFLGLKRRFPNLQFRFVGCGDNIEFNSLGVDQRTWSETTEAIDISECDIGIMPLQDDEFERGKCGLKLLQYMAAGLPVVASPVGENRYIVEDGRNGFLAADEPAWVRSLELLIRDHHLRAEFGRLGRKKVEEKYSLQYGFNLWTKTLHELLM